MDDEQSCANVQYTLSSDDRIPNLPSSRYETCCMYANSMLIQAGHTGKLSNGFIGILLEQKGGH